MVKMQLIRQYIRNNIITTHNIVSKINRTISKYVKVSYALLSFVF